MIKKFGIYSIVLFWCTGILYSCFIYGRPDSFSVNFVGMDLDNFVEYEKTEEIPITNMDYTIIYLKKTLVEMGPPDKPTKGRYQVSYLALRKISGGSEEITIQEGNEIEEAIVDKENQRLFYTFRERKDGADKDYLVVYDLENTRIVNIIMVLDTINYEREHWALSGAYISRVVFNDAGNKIVFQVNYHLDTVYYEGRDYLSLDVNTGEVKEISKNEYNEVLDYLNIPESRFTYVSQDTEKKLFFIYPYSDYLPANYKHKYNGIYINDGSGNIRISKEKTYIGGPVLWLEDGRYVICGSYLFDTSGKMKEVRIADGNVLAVY